MEQMRAARAGAVGDQLATAHRCADSARAAIPEVTRGLDRGQIRRDRRR